jgi:hypothetical protein
MAEQELEVPGGGRLPRGADPAVPRARQARTAELLIVKGSQGRTSTDDAHTSAPQGTPKSKRVEAIAPRAAGR